MTLLEVLIALPLLSMMLLSLGTAFLLLLRLYFYNLGDTELQEQLRLAAVDVVMDLSYADRVEVQEAGVRIWSRRRSGGQAWIEYQVKNPRAVGEITKNTQPLTGDSVHGDIRITKFHCSKLNERTILVEIEGVNKTTGKIFAIETAAFLQNAVMARERWKGSQHDE